MDWKLELVILPVTDVDRAKVFYERLGWHVDVDHRAGDFRVVQLTPPGSACSITMGTPGEGMVPGSVRGLHLVVDDIAAAHAQLVAAGAEPGPVHHYVDGAPVDGPHPSHGDYESFVTFADPDGNAWVVQEVPSRATAGS